MQLSHLFDVSPFLALSFCVCLGTLAWCAILLRRGCHHIADHFLIGFIGLLSTYQSIQILRRGGILELPHLRQLDEAVDLLVNSLFLLAALLLRLSNHDRVETMFRLRLAEAQPMNYVPEPRLDSPGEPSTLLDNLRPAAQVLSPNGLKLYLHVCLQSDGAARAVKASEDELLRLMSNDRKALHAALQELRDTGLCEVEKQSSRGLHLITGVTSVD